MFYTYFVLGAVVFNFYSSLVFAQIQQAEEAVAGGDAIVDIIKSGVSWPEGSAIKLDKRTGTLIVNNTPDNQKVIEQIIRSYDVTPTQVSIETRFIDIKSAALRDLGVTWDQIGSRTSGNNQSRGFTKGSNWAGDIDIPVITGTTSIITALRSFSNEGLSATFTRLNDTQLTAVLQSIEKTGKANTLSAPRVTVINRQEAVIKIISEYLFASDYEEYYIINGSGAAATQSTTLVPIAFEPMETGIILTVTPDVGKDNRSVTLNITPTVSELTGWVSYGTGTETTNYAQIDSRDIKTSVIVADGETVVMGGLIKGKSSETVKKVPIAGDIPLLGRLFKRKVNTDEQRSLLIFVTVDLLTPAGEKFRN